MNAHTLLTALQERGVELFVADDQLRYRAPAGVIDDELRRAAADHRADLIALLSGPALPEWDAETADVELHQAKAAIGAALSAAWLSSAQRNLLGVFCQQVSDYHMRHDPQLIDAAGWIQAHVARWYMEQQEELRKPTGT